MIQTRTNNPTQRWQKFCALLLITLAATLFVVQGARIAAINAELSNLADTRTEYLAANKELNQELASLNAPETIETLARSELNMVYPGEQRVCPARRLTAD